MQRSPAGYRLYDDDAVERLAFITAGSTWACRCREITDLLIVGVRLMPAGAGLASTATRAGIAATQQ
jgi:hypothetical protein